MPRFLAWNMALLLCCAISACTDEGSTPQTPVDMAYPAVDSGLNDSASHPIDTGSRDEDMRVYSDGDVSPDAGVEDAMISVDSRVDGGVDVPPVTMDYAVETVDVAIQYQTQRPMGLANERRELSLRIYYPEGLNGQADLLIVSHGGQGSRRGHLSFGHLGAHYASRGYISAHIGHRTSPGGTEHRWDRPHDVSAVIDYFETMGSADLPDLDVEVRTDAVGHIGHSWGAYTAHAVAGGGFLSAGPGTALWDLRDHRVAAMVGLSPQGPLGFGAYDEVCQAEMRASVCPDEGWRQASEDNTWRPIMVPTFHLIGQAEMDGVAGIEAGNADAFRATNWRLYPYLRVPADGRRFLSIIPDGTHSDLGSQGPIEMKRYIAINSRLFFDVYIRGRAEVSDDIGRAEWIEGVDHQRK